MGKSLKSEVSTNQNDLASLVPPEADNPPLSISCNILEASSSVYESSIDFKPDRTRFVLKERK
jgi:hypothetical protein